MFNAHIRGWINYYGRFYPSALYPTLRHIDVFLARWANRKFKSLRRRFSLFFPCCREHGPQSRPGNLLGCLEPNIVMASAPCCG